MALQPVAALQDKRTRSAVDPMDPKCLTGSGSVYGSGKNHSGSGQLRIRNEFEVKLLRKLIKFDTFSTKMPKMLNLTI
jgi:hypothetical protein